MFCVCFVYQGIRKFLPIREEVDLVFLYVRLGLQICRFVASFWNVKVILDRKFSPLGENHGDMEPIKDLGII
jgi:hypothetical protein